MTPRIKANSVASMAPIRRMIRKVFPMTLDIDLSLIGASPFQCGMAERR
jgi:hypothetical protein